MIKFLKVSNIQLKPNSPSLRCYFRLSRESSIKNEDIWYFFLFLFFKYLERKYEILKKNGFKIFSGLYLELWLRLGAGCLGFNSRACSVRSSI